MCFLVIVLAAATVAAFWPALRGRVIDEDLLSPAGALSSPLGCRELWSLLADLRGGGYQPLTWLSLCASHAVHGSSPLALHVSNLVIHVATVLLVYWLGLRLLSRGRPTRLPHLGAFLAALLFAVHPLRVEPIAWGLQRGVLLASFFALLTALFYLRACRGGFGWWIAAFLCYAASLACGPWAAGLPLILLVLDVFPLRRHGLSRILLEKVPFAALAGAAVIVGIRTASPGFPTRLYLVPYDFFFYLWKTGWPSALLPIYELPYPFKPLAPQYLAACGGLVVLLILLACYARRVPALLVAAVSYVLLLLPVVLLLQTNLEEAGDRYSYLASVPCMLVLGAALVRLCSVPGPGQRAAAVAVTLLGLGIAGVLGVLTWGQARLWRTPDTLWTYAEKLAPHSALVCFRLGQEAEGDGEYSRAVQLYRNATDLRPALARAQLALGNALMHEMNFKDAVAAYRRLLAIEPHNAEAHFQLGAALAAATEFAPAEQELKQAAALAPADSRPRKALGHLYMLLRRLPEAVTAFRDALAIASHDPDAYYNLGRAYLAAGQTAEAAEAFRRALQEDPTFKPARQALDELTSPTTTSRASE